ncbi:MAG: hypothetical protein Q8N16_02680 [bacterium]|nr:hypothetical protein [bacterium]
MKKAFVVTLFFALAFAGKKLYGIFAKILPAIFEAGFAAAEFGGLNQLAFSGHNPAAGVLATNIARSIFKGAKFRGFRTATYL